VTEGTKTTKRTQETKKTESGGRCKALSSLKSFESPKKGRSVGGFIPAHGGYEDLLSYQKALVVYQATVHFCGRFVEKHSRTRDQMIQAARSGKQNIVEGSQVSGTSKETELKLTSTARGSLARVA